MPTQQDTTNTAADELVNKLRTEDPAWITGSDTASNEAIIDTLDVIEQQLTEIAALARPIDKGGASRECHDRPRNR